ncbi:MFS transporter [Candidatus Micrarchaeota archaeon]|nr:MFS transporter [Candidatus Micrarchaeota archaeon]
MGMLSGIRKNVFILGIVSFLTDVSSEMIFPILPVFLNSILGVGTAVIGLIEGIADSASSLFDVFIGYLSDVKHERKKFVAAGYALSSLSKLGIALAGTWPLFLLFRGVERIGKSVRTSPRDALIAESSKEGVRGRAFGLHRSMDTLGAIAGPAIAYLILSSLGESEAAYRTVFMLALIPAFLAVAVLWFFVREKPQKEGAQAPAKQGLVKKEAPSKKKPGFWESLRMLPAHYRRYLAISCLFSLSYFSFALLIVRASEIGISAADILLVYILYNAVYAAASIPSGSLADKLGGKPVIAASFLLYAIILAGFAFVSEFWQVALLFAVYGAFVSADDSVNKAYVSNMVKSEERATALGAYSTAVSAAYLPASVIFGALWAAFGAAPAFIAAAGVASIAGIAMAAFAK